eukprot:jgi/Tetstr1/447319/TSEL_034756.t1
MEIPTKVKSEVAKRVTAVKKDDLNQTELEVRVSRPVDKVHFDRLLRYCRAVFPIHKPVEDTLDISQDKGSVRATVSDISQIGRLCMSKNPSDIGGDAVIILKELLAPKIELADYGVAITLKREMPVTDTEGAMKSLFSGKRLQNYRLKRRFSFFAEEAMFSIDLTIVKQKVGSAVSSLYNAKERYEVEMEVMPGIEAPPEVITQKLFELTAEVLLVMNAQREGSLLKASERARILNGYYKLIALPENVINRFIGPQPVTLERANLVRDIEGQFDVLDNYTVTEKADGKRALLFINDLGQGFLLDMQMNPLQTDIMVPAVKSTLLDGELVTQTKTGTPIFKFLAFDAYFVKGKDIRSIHLVDLGDKTESRLSIAGKVIDQLGDARSPSVHLKKFYPRDKSLRILQENDQGAFEYEIDGLIFTPADVGVFQNYAGTPITKRTGTWGKVFKWKPSKDNSIDFKVVFDKTSKGDIVISNDKMHARLLVGRQGIGSSGMVDAYSVLTGTYNSDSYELLEFNPPDYGIGDPVSWYHPVNQTNKKDMPKCIQPPFESIEDESIVEFAWDLKSGKWRPLRIRHDKIKPNAYKTAMGVWRSIAYPVDIKDIMDPSRITDIGPSGNDDVYFARETARDGSSSQAMRRFHGYWIKNRVLIANAAKFTRRPNDKLKLFDIAVGEAGDLKWWMDNKYDVVVGVDNVAANILGSDRGAYARLSDAIQNNKDRKSLRYVFVTMSADKPVGLESIDDVSDPGLRIVAENLWKAPESRPDTKLREYYGLADQPFDVVSLQFALHYFCDTEDRLDALLDNVARYLRPGGVFIGTCLDGRAVDQAFFNAKGDVLQGVDNQDNIVWKLQKRYEGRLGKEGDTANLGKQIDVYVETINKVLPEYLVDFELLTKKLKDRDIVPLTPKQVKETGMRSSSELFEKTFRDYDWKALAASKDSRVAYNAKLAAGMSHMVKSYSFMNRWFMFQKRDT